MIKRNFTYDIGYDKYSEDLTLIGIRTGGHKPKEYRMCNCGKHLRLVSAHSKSTSTKCQICTQENNIAILESNGMKVVDRLDHVRYVVCMPCGHLKTSGVQTLVDSKNYCKICSEEKLIEKFNNFGVEVIELGPIVSKIKFPCGHEAERKTYTTDKPLCVICEEQERIDFLKKYNVEQIAPAEYKLACGHQVYTQNYKVLDDYKCPKCHEENVHELAKQLGITYTGVKNEKHQREFILSCGHRKFLRYKDINDRVVCAICEQSHYAKPCDLYVLIGNSNGLSFIKVGVAGVLDERIKEYRAKDVSAWFNVHSVGFPDKYTAIKYEKEFHAEFKDKRIPPEIMKQHMKEGFTECYPAELLTPILNYLRPFYEQFGGSNKFKKE